MIYDISISVANGMITWPGDPAVSITRPVQMSEGAVCNVTSLQMGVHTGTHIDAPYHFVAAGTTVDEILLETCFGEVLLLEVAGEAITKASLLDRIPTETKRVLIKTSNSRLWQENHSEFDTKFVAIDAEAAEYLVECGVELVGVDYLSVESFYAEEGNPVHTTLLAAEVVLLEGCNLFEVSEGVYTLAAFPIKVAGADGAPCRAVLMS